MNKRLGVTPPENRGISGGQDICNGLQKMLQRVAAYGKQSRYHPPSPRRASSGEAASPPPCEAVIRAARSARTPTACPRLTAVRPHFEEPCAHVAARRRAETVSPPPCLGPGGSGRLRPSSSVALRARRPPKNVGRRCLFLSCDRRALEGVLMLGTRRTYEERPSHVPRS